MTQFIQQALPISRQVINENLEEILQARGTAGIISLLILLWSASGMFTNLAYNINLAWSRAARRNFLQSRLVGLWMILGLIGLMAEHGAFEGASGTATAFEYWSLARYRGKFGRLMCPDKDLQSGEFLDRAFTEFKRASERWLTGTEPFTAKLNPAYAPYGDYDQLMRLEEWYGRE